ncbi:MAG: hypothetical protein NT062_17445, partial [Proteobacteria bacterium]|nr:hypothetical protein [Pseudomonadota bacterium]
GRVALDLPPDRDGGARARALLGTRIAARLVATSGQESAVRVTAYLGAPELAQTTSRGVQLFVGRRPVRDRGLLHAIAMGYGELVPRGRYPIAIVLVDVPGDAVDYNVHPQKLEVRFADAGAVCSAVRHVVQAGIAAASWRSEGAGPVVMTGITSAVPPRLPAGSEPTALAQRYAAQLADQRRGGGMQQARFGFDGTAAASSTGASSASPRTWAAQVRDQVRSSRAAEPLFARGSGVVDRRADEREREAPPPPEPELALGSGPASTQTQALAQPHTTYFSSLRYVGQIDLTYLACEGEGELVLVDQHAAHERVELARLQARSGGADLAIQRMLFPVTIEASEAQVALVSRVAAALARVGFEAEPFGVRTIAVKAVPAGIRHGDPAQLLRRLLDEWAAEGTPSEAELVERMLSEIACHSVVRAGDRLAPSEAETLLRSLDEVVAGHGGRGPHGRPLLLRLPLAEIARRFGR